LKDIPEKDLYALLFLRFSFHAINMRSSENTILVTGANGFIATQTVASLLESGYRVRGTVRSQASADALLKMFPQNSSELSVVVVPDMTAQGAFDEAVKGVNGVCNSNYPTLNSINATIRTVSLYRQ
jgi:uncharacterized protein YbjT (DUF2867 family)